MPSSEVMYLRFNSQQRRAISQANQALAKAGGPEIRGVAIQASTLAEKIIGILSVDQQSTLQRFGKGQHGGFSLRYNSYRFSLNPQASSAAVRAFKNFEHALNDAQPLAFVLQPDSAVLINNSRALHGRDIVQDNRRLLVRQFGYSPFAVPLVLAEDPLLVRG